MSEPDAQQPPRDEDLAARAAELEAELVELRERMRLERRQAERETHLRVERIRTLSTELRETRKELTLERRRHADLRRRRAVRLSIAFANRFRPLIRVAGAARAVVRRARTDGTTKDEPGRVLRATRAEEQALQQRLAAVLTTPGPTEGPLVSIVVVTRDGVAHLRRLLPSLETLAYRDLEVIVVDNGSTDATPSVVGGHRGRVPVRLIRNATNRSFSEANNQGVADAKGELILLLNNDVTPAGPHVVGRMVERLLADPTIGAVGSRLIYPRRQGPRTGPIHPAADLTPQPRGITFGPDDGVPRGRNMGGGDDPLSPEAAVARDIPAATAASFLVRRSAFDAVGGFSLGYVYGTEDVDLSLKLRAAGHRIVYEPDATFWHDESATQHRQERESRLLRQQQNRELFVDHWAPRIFREVFLDRALGRRQWSEEPLHVGVTLTRDDPEAGWGDWYTAHEVGDALAQHLGWRVSYLERYQDHWYEPDPSIDVVLSLLDALDVRRLPESMVTVAWIRNWTDRWLGHVWFDEYDIVLASSETSKRLIEAGSSQTPVLFPLATNPERFRPLEPGEAADGDGANRRRSDTDDEGRRIRAIFERDDGGGRGGRRRPAEDLDVAFVGNHWGEDRGIQQTASLLRAAGHSIALHGRGWAEVAEVADVAHGPVPYEDVPDVYRSARIVLDDTATPTLPYGAVNSRVFDALAAGTLVVTDNPVGVRELFGDAVPAATTPEELAETVTYFLEHPEERASRVAQLRAVVLERHTYAHRAAELRDILVGWAEAPHVDIAIGPPNWEVAEAWGDYHFGRAVQRQLQGRGIRSRVRLKSAWDGRAAARADAVVQVFGLVPRRTRLGQLSVLWIISHPELVDDELVDRNDLLFAASDSFAASLADRTGRPVTPLHQATDPDRFKPVEGGPHHELLFVANSRGVRRRIVDELTPTDRDLAVYGKGWTSDLLDPRHLLGEHIPNDELARVYAAASIVLNDHWPDMAELGFLSNRLYDASAAGAFVISDRVPGIEAEFDGGIPSFADGEELRRLIDRFLADPEARREYAGRARAAVLARHTFAHRAETLLAELLPLLEARPRRIVEDGPAERPAAEP
jgi:GT2 family glycosyltransferase/spore maturation protein CgeB